MFVHKKHETNFSPIHRYTHHKGGYRPFYWESVPHHAETTHPKDTLRVYQKSSEEIAARYPLPTFTISRQKLQCLLNLRLSLKQIAALTGQSAQRIQLIAQAYHLAGQLAVNSMPAEAG